MDNNDAHRDGKNKPRHISRLRTEMNQLVGNYHPWDSPASSTGSRDTVSTTEEITGTLLSNFSFNPDAEGTRRLGEDSESSPKTPTVGRSGRASRGPKTIINTSALGRAFPEWNGLDRVSRTSDDDRKPALYKAVSSRNIDTATAAAEQHKKNEPPPVYGTITEENNTSDNTFDLEGEDKGKRTRADMQPTVENESDCSTVLSQTPLRPTALSRRSRFARSQDNTSTQALDVTQALQDKIAQMQMHHKDLARRKDSENQPPAKAPARTGLSTFDSQEPFISSAVNKSGISPTGRSFFLPNFRFLPDWVFGMLKFSTMRNGVPVFVRSASVRTRLGQVPAEHDSIRDIGLAEEDEEIFVSLDKLQDEVRELHDHDAMLQREAEKLQQEVTQLQAELRKFKARKRSDSALGSDSDGSMNKRLSSRGDELEIIITQLQERLDEANNQMAVNSIHSSSLTAERDEALNQASAARDKCKKLQADVSKMQNDLESALQSLRFAQTENSKLRTNNNATTDEYRHELDVVRETLSVTRSNLVAVQDGHEKLADELATARGKLASLRTKLGVRDRRIAELEEELRGREEEMARLKGRTAIPETQQLRRQNDELSHALSTQKSELLEKGRALQKREDKIHTLTDENFGLSRDNRRLIEENRKLAAELGKIREQSTEDRALLNQLLTHKTTEQTETLLRIQEEYKQREETTNHRLERQAAALQEVKHQLAKVFSDLTVTSKPSKVTRVVEPRKARDGRLSAADNMAPRACAVDDDPTTEINMTQGFQTHESDFASILGDQIPKLKEVYNQLQNGLQHGEEAGPAGGTVQIDYTLPSLPEMGNTLQSKARQNGILRKPSKSQEGDTGRFSVSSAQTDRPDEAAVSDTEVVDATRPSVRFTQRRRVSENDRTEVHESTDNLRSRRNSQRESEDNPQRNTTGTNDTRPRRRNSVNSTVETRDITTEQNMTSAFIVPDITLQSDAPNENNDKAGPSLSESARRVLDRVCNHNSGNCTVCARIASYRDKHASTESGRKKTIRIERPVPVSDRRPAPGEHEADVTMRPSAQPGEALAYLIKRQVDVVTHLTARYKREAEDKYLALDKSCDDRLHREAFARMMRTLVEVDRERRTLYKLYDVLEGQKAAGQMMTQEELDVTVLSACGNTRASVMVDIESVDQSWNGFE